MATRYRDRDTRGRKIESQEDRDRLAWWSEARFGMFIHWGLYAIPAGKWDGKDIEGISEWIMFRAQIPVADYERLAPEFNPVKFDAREWVAVAKDAGAKYLVFTSKHHDGFALYDSAVSDYDIVDATPFARDPMKELAEACQEAGIRLCFYYSQDQDWHRADASGNTWDFKQPYEERDFAGYLEEKVKPQLREILTQYGPIGLIWFDTPILITREQSVDLVGFVHELQPECLVSGRVGNGVADYGNLGDNEIPNGVVDGVWETPATMNDTWAFKTEDHNWKSVETLLHLLVDLAGKGVNYLLNVGPTAEGEIPAVSAERMRAIGEWLVANGDAIYGTEPSPFPYSFDWGAVTVKGSKLYLMFKEWPGTEFALHGLHSAVQKAYLLAEPGTALEVVQEEETGGEHGVLRLGLPAQGPDANVSVVVLELDGEPAVEPLALQQPEGTIRLIPSMAERHGPAEDAIEIGQSGMTQNWYDAEHSLSWKFKVSRPGRFAVKVVTGSQRGLHAWEGGHRVMVAVGGDSLAEELTPEEAIESTHAEYFPEFATRLGEVEIDAPGVHELRLEALTIDPDAQGGLAVVSVELG